MKKEVIKIKGMHCASCAMTIEGIVTGLPGVKSAQVNFATETLLVGFDENLISQNKIREAVKSIGYDLFLPEEIGHQAHQNIQDQAGKKEFSAEGGKEFLSLKVLGMDSPHCAMVVEQAIKTLPGIEKTDSNYSNLMVKIVFDPKKTTEKQIQEVIKDAGYELIKETAESGDLLEKEKHERE